MTVSFRFILDEASWSSLAGLCTKMLESVLDNLIDRILLARERDEPVGKSSWLWEITVGEKTVADLLFSTPELDRDVRSRVSSALDRLPNWDDAHDCEHFECRIADQTHFAPSIAFAHQQWTSRLGIALLPLESAGRSGVNEVEVNELLQPLHFVTTEAEYTNFFREVIAFERVDEAGFAVLARSAFPQLAWAERAFEGLGGFSRPFRNVCGELVTHLSVLDDHGADLFQQYQGSTASEIGKRLAALGAPASGEDGDVMDNARAIRERTRTYSGRSYVFFWHTKLQPHIDRIHFLYDIDTKQIVVGLFTDHCYLP